MPMSQALISSWVGVLPTLVYVAEVWAIATHAQATEASITAIAANEMLREQRIFHAPITFHLPRLNDAEVTGKTSLARLDITSWKAPNIGIFGHCGLNVACFVRRTRLEQRFLSIPIPAESKCGVCLPMHRLLNFSILPGLAAVSCDF